MKVGIQPYSPPKVYKRTAKGFYYRQNPTGTKEKEKTATGFWVLESRWAGDSTDLRMSEVGVESEEATDLCRVTSALLGI